MNEFRAPMVQTPIARRLGACGTDGALRGGSVGEGGPTSEEASRTPRDGRKSGVLQRRQRGRNNDPFGVEHPAEPLSLSTYVRKHLT
jgi:hypothetical protein